MSAYHQRSGSPLRVAGLSLLAITLLYGGSFYTRDWRVAVHQAGQPLAEQLIRPSRGAMRPVAIEAMPTQLPARVATQAAHAEPEVTGAVARSPEPVVGPPTAPLAAQLPWGRAVRCQPQQPRLLQFRQGRLPPRRKHLRLALRCKLRLGSQQ